MKNLLITLSAIALLQPHTNHCQEGSWYNPVAKLAIWAFSTSKTSRSEHIKNARKDLTAKSYTFLHTRELKDETHNWENTIQQKITSNGNYPVIVDQTKMFFVNQDNKLELINPQTKQTLYLSEHTVGDMNSPAHITRDESRAILCHNNFTIFDLNTNTESNVIPDISPINWNISSNDKLVITQQYGNRHMKLYNVDNGALTTSFKSQENVQSAHFKNNDTQVVLPGAEGIETWNLETQQKLSTIKNFQEDDLVYNRKAQLANNKSILIAQQGYMRETNGNPWTQQYVNIYDLNKNTHVKTVNALNESATSFCVNPEGTSVAVACISDAKNGFIRIQSLVDDAQITLEGPGDQVYALCYTKDGRLVSAGTNGIVQIWNPINGDCIKTYTYKTDKHAAFATMLDTNNQVLLHSFKNTPDNELYNARIIQLDTGDVVFSANESLPVNVAADSSMLAVTHSDHSIYTVTPLK
ncbi:hypothetical protein Noda2021_00180 [Candidatus Dependentiae bacterium Noda2021]|nr:hypothetical protein Noda2021_00180 [Candidatus Dependentiae bacterium Noda2021]